jgi:hypothetical protein
MSESQVDASRSLRPHTLVAIARLCGLPRVILMSESQVDASHVEETASRASYA